MAIKKFITFVAKQSEWIPKQNNQPETTDLVIVSTNLMTNLSTPPWITVDKMNEIKQ